MADGISIAHASRQTRRRRPAAHRPKKMWGGSEAQHLRRVRGADPEHPDRVRVCVDDDASPTLPHRCARLWESELRRPRMDKLAAGPPSVGP